jgi:purine-binding chemotaxis protein CheW
MGIVVDAVSEVYNVDDQQLQPPPDFGNVVNVEFIKGIATVDEKMLILLDIDHLLTSGELSITDSVTEQ